ncbi:Uma2 family endonuclease [Chamaesiphon sp. VAR_48_metabat_135_sub]|uniref:Uma2 family endonuclease n=1 Tax=Chamaesiphon sp. VAR_48_metabat_135_sub TaxID=2964699 RepID=UPI00286C49AE|nr:Uma2 family endonuclease [Chamaesiphon sp. VAR_48_metabat_135_sub]
MVLAESKTISFDDFIAWLPERSAFRYELRDGEILEMPKPRGKHSEIAGEISGKLYLEITRLDLQYLIPRESIVKSIDSKSGYEPDVIVLDKGLLAQEQRWETESIITQGSSVKLAIEVVSTNWQDDYAIKQIAYQALGIQEYWIVDYLGLGGRNFIGHPKQPTISIYYLVDGEYDLHQFRSNERIVSPTFPDLELSIDLLI